VFREDLTDRDDRPDSRSCQDQVSPDHGVNKIGLPGGFTRGCWAGTRRGSRRTREHLAALLTKGERGNAAGGEDDRHRLSPVVARVQDRIILLPGSISLKSALSSVKGTGPTGRLTDKPTGRFVVVSRSSKAHGMVDPNTSTEKLLPDAGYSGEATFQALEAHAITAYISLGHEARPAKPPNPAHLATQRMADRLTRVEGRARPTAQGDRGAGHRVD